MELRGKVTVNPVPMGLKMVSSSVKVTDGTSWNGLKIRVYAVKSFNAIVKGAEYSHNGEKT